MSKTILTTPLSREALDTLKIGGIFYLSGTVVTARDAAHKHRVLKGNIPETSLQDGAIFHAGPITKQDENGKWHMVSIGPTTSMRMERYGKTFMEMTGVKLVVGKGGMGANTERACIEQGAVHAVFPGGCAVVAANQVEEITRVEWLEELGMPEALWVCKVKEFGPLIVSIDTKGNNLFEQNKKIFAENKKKALEAFV